MNLNLVLCNQLQRRNNRRHYNVNAIKRIERDEQNEQIHRIARERVEMGLKMIHVSRNSFQ